jgi:hypothetical protein
MLVVIARFLKVVLVGNYDMFFLENVGYVRLIFRQYICWIYDRVYFFRKLGEF